MRDNIRKLLIVAVLSLAVLLVACEEAADDDQIIPSPAVTITTGQQETPINGETPTNGNGNGEPQDVCQPNPDPATPEFQVLDEPESGDTVASPLTVSGEILAFEASFLVTVFDADGDVIVEDFGTAEAAEVGELAPFFIEIPFAVDEMTPACVWVYERSARDGSIINVGQVPVLLSP